MAQTTRLAPSATSGRPYGSFAGKATETVSPKGPGLFTALSASALPGQTQTFAAKTPEVAAETAETYTGGYHRRWRGPRVLTDNDRRRLSEQARGLSDVQPEPRAEPTPSSPPERAESLSEVVELGQAIKSGIERVKALEAEVRSLEAKKAAASRKAEVAAIRRRMSEIDATISKIERENEELLVMSMFFDLM